MSTCKTYTIGTTYRFGYQGQFAEYDFETDYNHFEARLYNPRIGRWMTTDPAGQYWSPYLAMGNNWMNRFDPDGRLTPGDDPPTDYVRVPATSIKKRFVIDLDILFKTPTVNNIKDHPRKISGIPGIAFGLTHSFATPWKRKGIVASGYGISYGVSKNASAQSCLYFSIHEIEPSVALTLFSFDLTYFQPLNGNNVTTSSISGDGVFAGGSLFIAGYTASSNANSTKGISPTYRAHTVSFSNGLDVGYTQGKSKTYTLPILPMIGLLILN
ncbi:MAG: hypothetical protein IPO21_07910 [Bacteroidales bacterium]|nr:hypothetical protein [Bacteroidales bacterium]